MRYVSLFSGVEAASVAWSRLGWEPVAFAEVDEFPAAVLAHRFPGVPNLGDVCKVDWKEFYERYGAVDVVVGGSPCQSFSIAGNRTGLEGASGLMWQFCRAIRELVDASGGGGPRYVLWENVPGALSSGPKGQKGEDFGCLLRELADCGYGLAWRVLDSQFARVPDGSAHGFAGPVPQRRRRVFLVGSLGTDGAGDILFERTCLRGDHPKGREAREALARDSEGCAGMGDCAGFKYHQGSAAGGVGYEHDQSPTLTADYHQPAIVSLQGDGSSSNGSQNGCGYNEDGSAYTLNGRDKQAVCIQGSMVGRDDANGPRGGGATTTYRSPSTRSTVTPSRSPRTSAARSDWRAFDGSHAGALAAEPNATGQGRSLIMTQFGEVAGTLRARGDSSPNVDGGQNVVCMQDGQAHGAIENGLSTTLNASHEQPIVCAADDNGKAALETDMCGALKVGGGAVNSNGEMVAGVGSEY